MNTSGRSVVVGVDASVESHAALDFALRRAKSLGCVVDVITAWSATDQDADLEESRAARIQDLALDVALTALADPPVISRWVVRGDAGTVLERASRRAEVLVLGRPSGQGGVATYCSGHARVPVLIVPQWAETPRNLDVVA